MALFGGMIINGPLMAPFIGGFISSSYLGWRWVAYIPAFMGFFASIVALLFQDETYGPVILVSKAAELRRLTRNWYVGSPGLDGRCMLMRVKGNSCKARGKRSKGPRHPRLSQTHADLGPFAFQEVEVDLKELAVKNIARPLKILFTEPIVLLVTVYMSFLYGLLYLSLTAYGIVFGQIYGFKEGVSGLPYFGKYLRSLSISC